MARLRWLPCRWPCLLEDVVQVSQKRRKWREEEERKKERKKEKDEKKKEGERERIERGGGPRLEAA